MPVEIKELIIRTELENESANQTTSTNTESINIQDQEAIIQACVKQVLKILNQSKQR